MDGVLMGLLAGLVIAFIVYKYKQMKKAKKQKESNGGSSTTDEVVETKEQPKNVK